MRASERAASGRWQAAGGWHWGDVQERWPVADAGEMVVDVKVRCQ
ncbi:hypothetical protein [Paenibacillus lemnae]|nr:hypothetical protein [Paenibacillus lemnae]